MSVDATFAEAGESWKKKKNLLTSLDTDSLPQRLSHRATRMATRLGVHQTGPGSVDSARRTLLSHIVAAFHRSCERRSFAALGS